jgi:hypothetical protein
MMNGAGGNLEALRALENRDEDGGELVAFLAQGFKLCGGRDARGYE